MYPTMNSEGQNFSLYSLCRLGTPQHDDKANRMDDHATHILIVDDDASIREALDAALRARYIVHTAATGAEAFAILRENPIRAIILDAVLVDEHDLDLVPHFHAMTLAPILILTGYRTTALVIRALRAGVDWILEKPVNLQELYTTMSRLLRDPGQLQDSILERSLPQEPLPGSPVFGEEGAGRLGRRAVGDHEGVPVNAVHDDHPALEPLS